MILTLLGGVLVASLLGSLHCAAMCGPFVAVWVVGESGPRAPRAKLWSRASYHLGRLLVYASLGALAGALGSGIDDLGQLAGLSRPAAIVAGVLVLVSGIGLVVPRLRLPRFGERLLRPQAGRLLQLRTKSEPLRAGLLGGMTPLLPCGWLYAFVLTAAGTGNALLGASVMASFWLGTVPALLGMDAVLSRLSAQLRRRVPLVSGVVLVALGLFTIGRRLEPTAHPSRAAAAGHSTLPEAGHSCH